MRKKSASKVQIFFVSLDLNALWRTFLHQELKQFGLEHPER